MDDRKILATDARKTADTTPLFISRIYKLIRDQAKEGYTSAIWSLSNSVSQELLNSIVSELRDAGYNVELRHEDYNDELIELIIRW